MFPVLGMHDPICHTGRASIPLGLTQNLHGGLSQMELHASFSVWFIPTAG